MSDQQNVFRVRAPEFRRRVRDERGQVTVLAAVGLLAVAALMLVVVALGNRAAERAQAQTAADGAALAAAQFGNAVGHDVAIANGATVMFRSGRTESGAAVVRADATVGGSSATAQAQQGEVTIAGLAPVMVAALARAGQLMGEDVVIVSGWRSRADQERLWAQRHTNPYPVAEPGTSLHELGLAVDVPLSQVDALLAVANQVGLAQPLPETDPIHFIWSGS